MNFCRYHRRTCPLKLLHHIVELSENTVLDLSLENSTISMKIFAVFQSIYSHLLNRTNKLERKMHDDILQHFIVNSQTAHIGSAPTNSTKTGAWFSKRLTKKIANPNFQHFHRAILKCFGRNYRSSRCLEKAKIINIRWRRACGFLTYSSSLTHTCELHK